MEIIKDLNENSGVINLLFSFVVAVSTCFYAYLTMNLVRETKRLREVQTEPMLEVFYRSHEDAMPLLEFVVKNVGQGPAYNVNFQLPQNAEGIGLEELISNLRKMYIINSGINLLCPGQEFSSYWTDVRKNSEDKLKTPIKVITSCSSAVGSVYKREHILDLSELEGKIKLGTHPLYKIASSLEKIQKDIGFLSSGFHKLQVDIYSASDRSKEQKEIEDRIADSHKSKEVE